jgi:hypothetical protein
VEHFPTKIEVRVVVDGGGEAIHAELRAAGVPTSNGHNLLALPTRLIFLVTGFDRFSRQRMTRLPCETYAAIWGKWCCGGEGIQFLSHQPSLSSWI